MLASLRSSEFSSGANFSSARNREDEGRRLEAKDARASFRVRIVLVPSMVHCTLSSITRNERLERDSRGREEETTVFSCDIFFRVGLIPKKKSVQARYVDFFKKTRKTKGTNYQKICMVVEP